MKKYLIILLATLSLCACKNKTANDNATQSQATQTTTQQTNNSQQDSNILKTTPDTQRYDNHAYY